MKKIVICGSMQFIDKMNICAAILEKKGFAAITPDEGDWDKISTEKINEYKREVSLRYFNEVAREDTYGILVINETKKGVMNYIGANAFAEIAIAFYKGKKIFLLHDIYEPLADELIAWEATPLHGEMDNLKLYP